MTRKLIAAFALFACGALLAGLVQAQASGASFVSSEISVTNIDPRHFNVRLLEGTFSFRGMPKLHAALPKKHVTLDAARIDGTADTATKVIKTAKLTGGVKGTMDSESADGPEHTTFAGSSVNYTNAGGADDQSADLEVLGGVDFASTNQTVKRSLTLKGSHGLFKLREIDGSMGIASADLDGPVSLHFSGVLVDKKKGTKTVVAGNATGGHLTLLRPESSTNYIIRMSGGVHLVETVGPNPGAEFTTTDVTLEFDANGTLIKFGGEDESTTTVPAGKPPA